PTLFRSIIKEHIRKGYTKNENRLEELKKTIKIVSRTAKYLPVYDEAKGLFDVLSDYTLALDILDDYDHQRLKRVGSNKLVHFRVTYNEAKRLSKNSERNLVAQIYLVMKKMTPSKAP